MTSKEREGHDTERRSERRYATRLEAVVDDPELGKLIFTASGFSSAGAFLKRHDRSTPLPMIGSVVKLTFNWPIETNIPPVRVEAKVVRQTDDGVGVQFDIA
jgi:hypothetical protein